MGCERTMVGVVLCAMSAFLLAQSAPTSLKSSNEAFMTADELTSHEKPLVRTKRADGNEYGNNQNAFRVKKSDPSAVVTPDDDEATKTDANALPPEEQSLPEEKQSDEQEEYGGVASKQNNLEEIPIEATEGVSDEDDDSEEHQETARRKRSAKAAATLMTAENMASATGRTLRAKRDLDYEQLRELLENSREAEEEENDDDDVGPVALVPVLPETNSKGEDDEEEEEEGIDIPYPYDPGYGVSSEKEDLIRELVAKKEEEEAKEKMIDYLLASVVTEADDDDGRFLVQATGPLNDDEGAYIGPVADVKRSALYPYSYVPYGDRWGALVPGPKRSRLDEYERLNRLAEALRAYNDYEEEEEEEK